MKETMQKISAWWATLPEARKWQALAALGWGLYVIGLMIP